MKSLEIIKELNPSNNVQAIDLLKNILEKKGDPDRFNNAISVFGNLIESTATNTTEDTTQVAFDEARASFTKKEADYEDWKKSRRAQKQ